VAWGGIKDPTALVGRMWNHSAQMLDESLRTGRNWPRLSAQDATNIVSYLWRLPELRPGQSGFRFGDDAKGREIFGTRCLLCHTLGRRAPGLVALDDKLRGVTIPQLAAAMWNHAPAMKGSQPGTPLPTLTEDDTRDLVTYLVVARAFEETGNATRGERVFREKTCGACHGGRVNAGAPALTALRGPFDPVRITSVLWSHGPKMLDVMTREGMRWPRFREREMLDLLTYLNREVSK
jgi:mono/diheme cytochrome c family protein